jgi:imidazolonepropionase-like amidohydrolase
MIRSLGIAAAAVAVLAGPGRGQDLLPKAPPQTRPIVLQNAVVHTLDRGTFVGGTIWFDDGVIGGVHARGEAPTLPAGRDPLVVDAAGKHVFPGLVAASSQLGLVEIGMVRQTVDTDELGDMSPEVLAVVAVNPDSAALPVARSNGVLTAGVFPAGGLIPGRASVVQLDGWTNTDMTVRGDAGVIVAWPAQPTRDGRRRPGRRRPPTGDDADADAEPRAATQRARDRIDEAFLQSRAWLDSRMADPDTAPDLRAQALLPAVRGETPVFVLADELEQIESAVHWAIGRKLHPVLVGGRDAGLCADLLVQYDVPVILTGTHRLPRRDDSDYDEPFALPALLAERGVKFCIATGESFAHERNLPYHAATAAAFGLDRERALAAITRDAAQILGVGDRLGTLTVGKDATLFLADGNPLDLTTKIERAWIRGREVDLRNKQTELARKYREKYRQIDAGK